MDKRNDTVNELLERKTGWRHKNKREWRSKVEKGQNYHRDKQIKINAWYKLMSWYKQVKWSGFRIDSLRVKKRLLDKLGSKSTSYFLWTY